MEMEIFLYGKEVGFFRNILQDLKDDISMEQYTWKEELIMNNASGKQGAKFVISAKNGIVFYFLGEEFQRRKTIFILEHHSFVIPDYED